MERLTKKQENKYWLNCSYDEQDAIQQLGKLEDLQDELGVPLEVLFKALKNKKIYGRKHHIYDGSTKEEYPLYNKPLYVNNVCLTNNEVFNRIQITYHSETLVGRDKESSGMVCYDLKDYGKTWALTREELGNA